MYKTVCLSGQGTNTEVPWVGGGSDLENGADLVRPGKGNLVYAVNVGREERQEK